MGCCVSSGAVESTSSPPTLAIVQQGMEAREKRAPSTLSVKHVLDSFELRPHLWGGSYRLCFSLNGVVLKRAGFAAVTDVGPQVQSTSFSVPFSGSSSTHEWLTIEVTKVGLDRQEYSVMRTKVNLTASVTAEGSTIVLPSRTLCTTNAAKTVVMTHTLSGRVTTTADRSLPASEQATRPRAPERSNIGPGQYVSTNRRIGEVSGRTTAPYQHIDINGWMDDAGGQALKLPETEGVIYSPFGRQLSDAVFSAEGDPLCVVCMAEPPSVTLLPCKDRIMCEDCAARWLPLGHNCPVCRAATNGVTKD